MELTSYRSQLERFRAEFGGTNNIPDAPFFLFGMGHRTKYLYRDGVLSEALTGKEILKWDTKLTFIVPHRYLVKVVQKDNSEVDVFEGEQGVWIETGAKRERLPGTDTRIRLPEFSGHRYPAIMRVLHHELLINILPDGPVPNFFVYRKPWHRDGAMMAMCFKETGNLRLIRDWILNLREPYDRNNNGETEADNLGQALYLISLVSNKKHPLVEKILAEIPKYEVKTAEGTYIKGRSDFAEHPVYQTKWLKFGLRSLGLKDPYVIPQIPDGYSALFWMDYKDHHVTGKDSDDRKNYPYLGWACDHFYGTKKSPISNRDYPLTGSTRQPGQLQWHQGDLRRLHQSQTCCPSHLARRRNLPLSAPRWEASPMTPILGSRPKNHLASSFSIATASSAMRSPVPGSA